jgi:hypothetical protein
MLVTQEKLKALLEYDPDTGVFRWLKPMSAKAQPGAVAGSMGGGGKLYIGIEQRKYHAHQLAWFFVHGVWAGHLEHINGVRLDNRLSNLRPIKYGPQELTHEKLLEMFDYNPETGALLEKKTRRGAIPRDGRKAGWTNAVGYKCVSILRRSYLVHRLAWFYVHKHWPPQMIDHVNGDRGDNRLCNLRLASQSQNMANTLARKDSSTGIKGIFPTRAGKWAAQIAKDNKVHCLGTYETKEDAGDAYKKAAVNLHGEFAKF